MLRGLITQEYQPKPHRLRLVDPVAEEVVEVLGCTAGTAGEPGAAPECPVQDAHLGRCRLRQDARHRGVAGVRGQLVSRPAHRRGGQRRGPPQQRQRPGQRERQLLGGADERLTAGSAAHRHVLQPRGRGLDRAGSLGAARDETQGVHGNHRRDEQRPETRAGGPGVHHRDRNEQCPGPVCQRGQR